VSRFFFGQLSRDGDDELVKFITACGKKLWNNIGYSRITLQKRCFFYINNFWSDCLHWTGTVVPEYSLDVVGLFFKVEKRL